MRDHNLMRLLARALIMLCALLPSSTSAASSGPTISAPEAIVIDAWSGDVLYARHADREHDPASTVKVMTAMVVLAKLPLYRVISVPPDATTYLGSTAGLADGEQLSVWDLLHGMLLPSGNDAAVSLAMAAAGSVDRFVAEMNAEARHLRLWHTHYLTPNGFDTPGQVTSARDLASLTRAAMHNATFDRIVRTREWTARSVDGRFVHQWENLNRLLWASHAVNGVKTGTTAAAGACLVSSARRGARWVIAVNLGSSEASRFSDGAALLDYGLMRAGRGQSA